jgi:hypothetical protein
MKTASFVLAVLALAAPDAPARACDTSPNVNFSCCDEPTRWAQRYSARDARLAVTTRSGDVTLVLTNEVVAVQLSDRVLRKVKRETRREQDEAEYSVLARAIKTVVLTSVRAVLSHSAECSIADLSDVKYSQGRLVFTTEEGDRIFENVSVNDTDVMRDFSEADARAFVREFRRSKERSRQVSIR